MAGKYDERVRVKAGGAEGRPITFRAMSRRSATVSGFDLQASYLRIEGLDITAARRAVAVQLGGSHCEVLDRSSSPGCRGRTGVGLSGRAAGEPGQGVCDRPARGNDHSAGRRVSRGPGPRKRWRDGPRHKGREGDDQRGRSHRGLEARSGWKLVQDASQGATQPNGRLCSEEAIRGACPRPDQSEQWEATSPSGSNPGLMTRTGSAPSPARPFHCRRPKVPHGPRPTLPEGSTGRSCSRSEIRGDRNNGQRRCGETGLNQR